MAQQPKCDRLAPAFYGRYSPDWASPDWVAIIGRADRMSSILAGNS